jgi:hypothetical protein
MKYKGQVHYVKDYIRRELMTPLQKFNDAKNGTLVFVWGKGFISNGIRVIQKLDRLRDMIRGIRKFNINADLDMPTHVEQKIDDNKCVSCEATGVKELELTRYFKKKGIVIAIAEPLIEYSDDYCWQYYTVKFLRKQIGKMYDYFGFFSFIPRSFDWLLGFLHLRKHHFKFAYFCSELCCAASKEYSSRLSHTFRGLVPSMTSPEEMWVKVLKDPHWETEFIFSSLDPEDPDPCKHGSD